MRTRYLRKAALVLLAVLLGLPTLSTAVGVSTVQAAETVETVIPLAPTDDSYTSRAGSRNVNFNHLAYVQSDRLDSATQTRAFLKFDLADVYVEDVKKASLQLRVTSDSEHPDPSGHIVNVQLSDNISWSESTVHWNNQPQPVGSTVAQIAVNARGQVVEADVTAAIRQALAAGKDAVTFVLAPANSVGVARFHSKEAAEPANRPSLKLAADLAPDTAAPAAPAVTVREVSSRTATLDWAPAVDNVATVGYAVYRDGADVGVVSRRSFADAGLEPGTAYTYTVHAIDHAGNTSPPSASAQVFTTPLRSGNDILSFKVSGQVGATVINREAGTIEFVVRNGSDVSALEPVIAISDGASLSPNGPQSFASPVVYTVTAENGAARQWTARAVWNTAKPAAPAVKTVKPGDGHVLLVWDNVPTAQYYRVEYGTESGVYTTVAHNYDEGENVYPSEHYEWQGFMPNSHGVVFAVEGLLNGKQYRFAVTAYNENGQSVRSQEVTATPAFERPDDRFFGVHIGNDTNAELAIPLLKEMGATSVRMWLDWNMTGPLDGPWHANNAFFAKARQFKEAGFYVIVELYGNSNTLKATYNQFKPWMEWLVHDDVLGGVVDAWEVWNELNVSERGEGKYWKGTVQEYIEGPLKAAWDVVHENGRQDRGLVVAAGQTAWTLNTFAEELHVNQFFDLGGEQYADIINTHPYTGAVKDQIRAIDLVRSRASKPIWMTEWNFKQVTMPNPTNPSQKIYDIDRWTAMLDEAQSKVRSRVDRAFYYRLLGFTSEGGWPGLAQSVGGAYQLNDFGLQYKRWTTDFREGPTAPSNAAASVVGKEEIRLSWEAASDNIGVAGYRVYRNDTLLAVLGAESVSYLDEDVKSLTTYQYYVAAFDAAGNETRADDAAVATTPDWEPPATPSGVSADALNYRTVKIVWHPASDNVAIAGYRVYRSGELIASLQADQKQYVDNLADPSANYAYTVTAVDAAANESSASLPIEVRTPAFPGKGRP